jgi:hypothetical protein
MNSSRKVVAAMVVLAGLVGCSSDNVKNGTGATASEPAVSESMAQPNTETATVVASETTVETALPAETTLPIDTAPTRNGAIEVTGQALGGFEVGEDAQTVIDGLTALLGEPTEDTGWQPNQSACEGMGDRSRSMSFGRVIAEFAVGPTLYISAEGEHFSSFSVTDGSDVAPGPERFVFSDRLPALGRTKEALLAWNPQVTFDENEIRGPVYLVGFGKERITGIFGEPDGGGAPVSRTIEVGLFCND